MDLAYIKSRTTGQLLSDDSVKKQLVKLNEVAAGRKGVGLHEFKHSTHWTYPDVLTLKDPHPGSLWILNNTRDLSGLVPREQVRGFARQNGLPWLFYTSTDPGVAKLANTIEARYPGHVLGINMRRGGTEIDIETANAIIEVKSRRGTGFGRQIAARVNDPEINPLGKPVIGYSPNLSKHAAKEIERRGGLAAGGHASDLETLLELIRP
jgi:hypothetical protein